MTKLASSPERHTFYKQTLIERAIANSDDMNLQVFKELIAVYDMIRQKALERESDPNWKINNLEYDLRSTEWIVEKARTSNKYTQHLYAALCNNNFQKLDVMSILADSVWGCSWRYAGGIVANIRGEGDYTDWYCSGINTDDDRSNGHVPEGLITREIEQDFKSLGWIVKHD